MEGTDYGQDGDNYIDICLALSDTMAESISNQNILLRLNCDVDTVSIYYKYVTTALNNK